MSMPMSRPGGADGKGAVFQKCTDILGTATGIGVSILATPPVWEWTRKPLLAYLTKTWGHDLGNALTWMFGGVEAVSIYAVVKLIVFTGLTFSAAWLAARRL